MARTFTAGERSAISAAAVDIQAKLELKDYDGDWTDVSTGLGGGTLDWLNDITLEEDIDSHSMILNASLLRDNASTLSLAPLRSDSTLNRDNSANYQPFLDLARQWRVSVSVVAHGDATNYKEIGAGTYDVIDVKSPSPTVQIVGRDYGAALLDRYIEIPRTYGAAVAPRPALEDVIQQLLDDHFGSGVITLYVPGGATLVTIGNTEFADINVMEAVNLLASRAGMVCRYRYDASDAQRLTLYAPDRTIAAGSEAWTLGPSEYLELPHARLDLSGIRNKIVVQYYSDSAGVVLRTIRQNATSIARYGGVPRIMLVDVSKDTSIRTSTRAEALGDAILSDLAVPPMEQQFETTGFWIAQLSDYGKFSSNSVHYDSDQYGGVTRIEHRIANGTIRTTLSVRGQPAGKYRGWLDNSIPVGVAPLRIIDFRETARSATTVTFSWTTEGVATEQWLWLETQAQPVASDPWPSLDTVPDYRLTSATTTYTVDIPVDGSVTYGVLVPVGENAAFGRPWQFTVQRTGMEAVPDGVVTIDATGAVGFTMDGPSWALSHKWSSSTSDYPSEATVRASGTTVNGRQLSVSTGDTLAIGEDIFITVLPYSAASAGGVEGSAVRLKGIRHDFSSTKTVYFSTGAVMLYPGFPDGSFYLTVSGGYVTSAGTGLSPSSINAYADMQIPQGCTLTDVSCDAYYTSARATGLVSFSVYEVDASGTDTLLGNDSTTSPGIGDETLSVSLSDTTTTTRYRLLFTFVTLIDADISHHRVSGFRFTYSMPTSSAAL